MITPYASQPFSSGIQIDGEFHMKLNEKSDPNSDGAEVAGAQTLGMTLLLGPSMVKKI